MNAYDDDHGAGLVTYDPPLNCFAMRAFVVAAGLGLLAIGCGVWWAL